MGYQDRDRDIIDYHLYELPGVKPHPGGGRFRGPRVTGQRYVACVGAAQTFGCFCEKPYPALLAQSLGVETLNLGAGGAGPTFHNSSPELLKHINAARLVIVQVLSARSQSNSLFQTTHHGMEGVRLADGKRMIAQEFFAELLSNEPHRVREVVEETRRNYLRDMIRLLGDISPPKILFWFSIRRPEYQEAYELPVWKLWGAFPQFVNRQMVETLQQHCDDYVECVSNKGLPQPLFDKSGKPTTITYGYSLLKPEVVTETHNRYYPSPEMHEEAARLLEPVCRKYL